MNKTVLMPLLALLLFASCNRNDYDGPDLPGSRLVIIARSDQHQKMEKLSWKEEDNIGITATIGKTAFNNIKCQLIDGTTDEFSVLDVQIFIKGKDPVQFAGYFPFKGEPGTNPGLIGIVTSAENQKSESQHKLDYLYAKAAGSRDNPKVELNFQHKMSKLDLKIQAQNAGEMKMKVGGIYINGTFNILTGEIKSTGQKENIAVSFPFVNENILSLILLPQEVPDLSIEVEFGGKFYSSKLTNISLSSGKTQSYTIALNQMNNIPEMTINSDGIADWILSSNQNINSGSEEKYVNPYISIPEWESASETNIESSKK